jgi:hypothetical protein
VKKRWPLKIALCLLAGAVVALLTAWVPVLWPAERPLRAVGFKYRREGSALALRFRALGVERTVLTHWSDEPDHLPRVTSPSPREPFEAGYWGDIGVNENEVVVAEEARGWPLLALSCSFTIGRNTDGYSFSEFGRSTASYDISRNAPSIPEVRGGLVVCEWNYPSVQATWRVLPLRPLWPGSLVNTLLGAGVLLGLAETFAFARWGRRRLKSRCPSCGYDRCGLAKDAACPECGVGGAA